MKKLFIIILALIAPFSLAFAAEKGPKELKVMSYNIRLGVGKDGTNSWQYRAPATIAMLEAQNPDVFGVQEAYGFQIAFIEEYCKNFENGGGGREDGKKKGEGEKKHKSK